MFGKPKVDIAMSPANPVPGRDLFVEVLVKCTRATRVKYVDVSLLGTEHVRTGSGRRAPKDSRAFLSLGTRYETKSIASGETTFRASFPLPAMLPPAYEGRAARIMYELIVHAPVSFGRDIRARREVPISTPGVAPARATPGVFATSHGGPRGTDPSMELAIETTTLAPGDLVVGQIALANIGKKRIRSVGLSFEQKECIKAPSPCEDVRTVFDARVFEGTPENGRAIPFEVRLPASVVADFYTDSFAVATDLVVRADVAYGDDFVLRVPLSVLERHVDARESVPSGRVSIPVGNDRLLALVEAAGRALDFAFDGVAVEGREGGVHLRLSVQRERDAVRTVATLTWPELAVGLSLGTDGSVDKKGRRRVVLPEQNVLAPKLLAFAKDQDTARSFLNEAVVLALEPFDRVSMEDGEVTVARTGPVVAFDDVFAVGQAAVALAKAIEASRTSLPERDVVRDQGLAWEAFAVRYGGRLDRSALRVQDARFEGMPFEVRSYFGENGCLSRVEIWIRTAGTVPRNPMQSTLKGNGGIAQKRIATLLKSGARVEGRGNELVLVSPSAVRDPVELLPYLGPLAALGRALDGSLSRIHVSSRFPAKD